MGSPAIESWEVSAVDEETRQANLNQNIVNCLLLIYRVSIVQISINALNIAIVSFLTASTCVVHSTKPLLYCQMIHCLCYIILFKSMYARGRVLLHSSSPILTVATLILFIGRLSFAYFLQKCLENTALVIVCQYRYPVLDVKANSLFEYLWIKIFLVLNILTNFCYSRMWYLGWTLFWRYCGINHSESIIPRRPVVIHHIFTEDWFKMYFANTTFVVPLSEHYSLALKQART